MYKGGESSAPAFSGLKAFLQVFRLLLVQTLNLPGCPVLIHEKLANKDLIMGFGHRVYTTSDPRNAVNKAMSKRLAEDVGNTVLYPVSEAVEKVMWDEKKLFANADFFAASVYHFMGIPTDLFTPIFVCSRITGWAAHVMEQRANNKLIRPAADYIGPDLQQWVAIQDRG